MHACRAAEEIERPGDADGGLIVGPAWLVATLEGESRVRPLAGLLPGSTRDLDVRAHRTKRRFALERPADGRLEPEPAALVDVPCRRCRRVLAASRDREHARSDDEGGESLIPVHCTLPSSLTEPLPAGPFHSIVIGHAPAMPNSAVAAYRPGTSAASTCTFPDSTIPGIAMVAPTRTVPTSTRAPEGERNSIVKVFRPLRNVPVGDRTTMSIPPDRSECTTGSPGLGELTEDGE